MTLMVGESGKPSPCKHLRAQLSNQTWAGSSQFRVLWGDPTSLSRSVPLSEAVSYAILFDPHRNSMNRFYFPHFIKEETKPQRGAQSLLIKCRARMNMFLLTTNSVIFSSE